MTSASVATGGANSTPGTTNAPIDGLAEEALKLKLERQFAAAEASFGGYSLLGGLSFSGGLGGSRGLLSGDSLLAGLDGDDEEDDDG